MKRPKPNPKPIPHKGAPRGKPNTTVYEMRERRAFALRLLELGMTHTQVARTLVLPPVRTGETDEFGQPKVGGLGLSDNQARAAVAAALRHADMRWEANRASDRISQKMILESAIAGAMRDRKWGAIAPLAAQLARITGTNEPIEVVVSVGDARKRAMMQLIAGMPEAEFVELVGEGEPPQLPPATH